MTTAEISFAPNQQSSADPLTGASQAAFNVVAGGGGEVKRRPCLLASDLSSDVIDAAGIDGLYTTDANRTFAVAGGVIYRVTPGGAVAIPGLSTLHGGRRAVFAETEMLVVIAGGDAMVKVELATATGSLLGGSPPISSHVIANSSRLLSNDLLVDRTKVRYSDIAIGTTSFAGHETWLPGSNGAGFFTAEARPDAVVAIGENTNEVFVWGTETTQIYAPDPTLIFSPVRAFEWGCAAPYSIVKADGQFFWLDHKRRIVGCDGGNVSTISKSIQGDLNGMTTVDDCFGYRVHQGNTDALVWTFPSDGRTFVFQVGAGWGQWQGWDQGRANWKPFLVTAAHQRLDDAENLVGTSDGRVGQLSQASQTDFGDPVPAYVDSGFQNRGTSGRKACKAVRLTMRRGRTTGAGNPRGSLWFRDNPGKWEGPLPVELGRSGEVEAVVSFRSLGTYRTRQWRFRFDGSEELTLAGVEEDFDVVGG